MKTVTKRNSPRPKWTINEFNFVRDGYNDGKSCKEVWKVMRGMAPDRTYSSFSHVWRKYEADDMYAPQGMEDGTLECNEILTDRRKAYLKNKADDMVAQVNKHISPDVTEDDPGANGQGQMALFADPPKEKVFRLARHTHDDGDNSGTVTLTYAGISGSDMCQVLVDLCI